MFNFEDIEKDANLEVSKMEWKSASSELKVAFDSLISEGFTPEEAIKLIVGIIKGE